MNISRKHVLHKSGSDISKFHYKWIQHEDMRSRNKPQNTLNEVSLHQISTKAAIQISKLTNSPLFSNSEMTKELKNERYKKPTNCDSSL